MPFSTAKPVLVQGFLPVFQAETAPASTADAAKVWAETYSNYVTAGGATVPPPKKQALETALTAAFNPALGGGGLALFLSALVTFWPGIATTSPVGTVASFIPVVTTPMSLGPDATVNDQANSLADWIHTMTIASVVVTTPGGPAPLV